MGGPSRDDGDTTTASTRPLGTKAVIAAGATTTSTTTSDRTVSTISSTTPTSAAGSPTSAATPPTTQPMAPVARITDRTGDHGVFGPTQSDIAAVTMEANEGTVRITVTLAGPVPARLRSTDVEGIGVDLFAPGNTNPRRSDSQVFATGDDSGWYGYLSVGTGDPEPLPGTLTIDGRDVVFEVPSSALHAPRRGSFSAFVDFSRDATPTNTATEDHAPDLGTSPYPSDAR